MIHIVVMAAGIFASGGYARFMVTIAPFMAILAAAGMSSSARAVTSPASGARSWLSFAGMAALAWLAVEIEYRAGRLAIRDERFLMLIRAIAAITIVLLIAGGLLRDGTLRRIASAWLIGLVLIHNAALIRPLRMNDAAQAVARTVDRIKTQGLDHRPIFATNSWFAFCFDWAEDPRAHKGRRLVASMPVGTLVIWDSIYSASDYHRLPLEWFDHTPAYRRLHEMTSAGTRPIQLIVFEKVAETPIPAEPDVSYPPNLANQQDEVLGRYYRQEGT
jgi:hypothetical protein